MPGTKAGELSCYFGSELEIMVAVQLRLLRPWIGMAMGVGKVRRR